MDIGALTFRPTAAVQRSWGCSWIADRYNILSGLCVYTANLLQSVAASKSCLAYSAHHMRESSR